MIARRLPLIDGWKLPPLNEYEPGDYCGPTSAYTGNVPSVTYMLPVVVGDEDEMCWFGHVTTPPHSFRECSDGSLEIRESILHRTKWAGKPLEWHGYLDEGHVWRQV